VGRRRAQVEPRARAAYRPVSEAYLRSSAYTEAMSRHLPHPGVYDLHEAQNWPRSFHTRHQEVGAELGLFRWRGIQQHLDEVLAAVTDPGLSVVDFGGAACPLGFESVVVDLLEEDGLGRPVRFHSLEELGFAPDVVFSSHTLEHVGPIEQVLAQIHERLRPGGKLMLHLPAYTCERWRAGLHRSRSYSDHLWTFGLRGSEVPEGLERYREIDAMLERWFELDEASYCGDDSIYIVASKRGSRAR
jgi:SAM-dependent methyltransferase